MRGNNTDSISVFYGLQKAGELRRSGRAIVFAYDSVWQTCGFPLSLSLPLTCKTFDAEQTEAFFGNLLPEEGILAGICRSRRLSRYDLIGFFREFGRECAGALAIADRIETPDRADRVDVTGRVIEHLRDRAGGNLFLRAGSRLSLAGAQDKLPVAIENGRFFVSAGFEPTTHILKPENRLWPGSARNEHLCMELAQASGCEVARTELLVKPEGDILLIERFDRIFSETGILRIHQEDFCQALGLAAQYKYHASGGYDGVSTLRDLCARHDIAYGDSLARMMIMNSIVGNYDGHLKNISLLHFTDATRIAPFYDLLSTGVWPDLDHEFAMAFGRAWTLDAIRPEDMALAAEECGMAVRDFCELAAQMANLALTTLPGLIRRHEELYGAHPVYARIGAQVRKGCAKMAGLAQKSR